MKWFDRERSSAAGSCGVGKLLAGGELGRKPGRHRGSGAGPTGARERQGSRFPYCDGLYLITRSPCGDSVQCVRAPLHPLGESKALPEGSTVPICKSDISGEIPSREDAKT